MSYRAETRVLPVDALHPDAEAIEEAAGVLRRGGLVAFPTETVYGLGANARDADAVDRIFAAKGRPASDPLIVHIASIDMLDQVTQTVPPLARELVSRFFPGPLTLVLRRHPSIPPNVSAGRDTVAVRMPSHPVALALLRASGLPIAAPSANLFSRPSPTTAQHVLDDLRGRVDIVLDSGATTVGVESTVLDLTQEPPVVLRPGGVPVEALREWASDVVYTPRYLGSDEAASAPGMLLKHYSPRAELRLFAGSGQATLDAMGIMAAALGGDDKRVGILTTDDAQAAFANLPVERVSLGRADDLEGAARRLFAALRDLDSRGVDVILAHWSAREGVGLAVWDRLVRAAEGRVLGAE